MDANNDLVISVNKNYSWEPLRNYAVSLYKSGFRGKKLMFVQDINAEARRNLETLGFTLIDFSFKDNKGGFPSTRFEPIAHYISNNPGLFRYVIWTDSRDVVFQSDPSVWLENNIGEYQLVVCSEGGLLKDEPTNVLWVTNASNGLHTDLEQEQLCSGTIAGTAEAMRDISKAIFEESFNIQQWDSSNGSGSDQGLLNYLVHLSPFKEISRIVRADEAFALQANWFMIKRYEGKMTTLSPRFDMSTGLAFTPNRDVPYTILHQYDRDASGWLGNFTAAVENRYVMSFAAPEEKVVGFRPYRPLTNR